MQRRVYSFHLVFIPDVDGVQLQALSSNLEKLVSNNKLVVLRNYSFKKNVVAQSVLVLAASSYLFRSLESNACHCNEISGTFFFD